MQVCPNEQSVFFIKGYAIFTESFFESITSLSKIFYDLEENTCDIDFEFSAMEALEEVKKYEKKLVKDQEEYLKGALLAEFNSLRIVLSTYKPRAGKIVA